MGVIHRIKLAVLTRLLRRPAVLDAATGVILHDPDRTHRIVANPDLFPQILNAIAKSQQAATMALEHPEVRKRIVRNPGFFEAMLDHTAHQPEALSKLLSRREVRRNLSAQKGFLSAMANEGRVIAELVKTVPARNFASTLSALLSRHKSQIEALDAGPEATAAALLTALERTDPAGIADEGLIDMLLGLLGENIVPVLQTLATRDPELVQKIMGTNEMRDMLARAMSTDLETVETMASLYVTAAHDGQTAAERATALLSAIIASPAFERAAAREPQVVSRFLLSDGTRDLLVTAMSTDHEAIEDLFRQYVAMPTAGADIPARISTLMEVLLSDPVFARALSRDADLRLRLFRIVAETFDRTGADLDTVRDQARAAAPAASGRTTDKTADKTAAQ